MPSIAEKSERVTELHRSSGEIKRCDVCDTAGPLIGYSAKNELLVERTSLYSVVCRLTAPTVHICMSCFVRKIKADKPELRGLARCTPEEKALVVHSRKSLACFFDTSLLKLYLDLHRYYLNDSNKRLVSILKRWICKDIRDALDECIQLDLEYRNRDKNMGSCDSSFWQASPGFEGEIFKELFTQITQNPTFADKDVSTFLKEDRDHKGKLPRAAVLAERIRRKYWKLLYEKTPISFGGIADENC